ncbi:imidazole glycerol phosphate synthase subunit HisH [Amedibacillus sp. YH-ame6]
MIAVIDYGMGNLHSVINALEKIGAPCVLTNDPKVLEEADKLILPGVGAFPDCMKNLEAHGLIEVLHKEVIEKKKPLLGICLGMQALFEESDEIQLTKGLGFLPGRIEKMEDTEVKIPHIGWNLLEANMYHPIFDRMSTSPFMYYVHSYVVQGYVDAHVLGYSHYGSLKIPGLLRKDNILGAQFHPEKSGEDGLSILTYFKEEFV